MENPFDIRRQKDPQGVIDDLVSCMTRQGKVIGEKDKEIERLSVLLVEAGIDPQKPPEPKKKGGRKKKEESQEAQQDVDVSLPQ